MKKIPDFTQGELWMVETTLKERYGQPMALELADAEMRLDANSTQMVECPCLFWRNNECSFVIVKVGDGRYRNQFFYRVHQQFGTGIDEYDNITECAVSLLQMQADHEAKIKRQAEQSAQR
jgi:hypothetical protein